MHRCFFRWLFLFNCSFGALNGHAQQQTISVESFGEDKGLNVTSIYHLLQDSEGFIWLATGEGLIRFDGHTFRYFRHQPGDSSSISGNLVHSLAEDREGNIWIGMLRGGVSRYDKQTGKFKNYRFTDHLKIKTASVLRLFFDSKNRLWLGVSGYGLAQLDPQTGQFQIHELVTPASAPHLETEAVSYYNVSADILEDENGLLWCATPDDLVTFNPETGAVIPHRFNKTAKDGFPLNQANCLLMEEDWLWVGGWGSGLRRYHRKTGVWEQFLPNPDPAVPDAVNVVFKIVRLNDNELLLSTSDKGICLFNQETKSFVSLNTRYPEQKEVTLSSSGTILADRQNNFWLTYPPKLLRLQFKDKPFVYHQPEDRWIKQRSSLLDLMDDREQRFRLIAPNALDGILVYDKKNGKTSQVLFPDGGWKLNKNHSSARFMQDRSGAIWVLTGYRLYRFLPESNRLELPSQPKLKALPSGYNYFTQFAEDKQGNLWIGTSLSGLLRFDPGTGITTTYTPDESKPGAVPTHVLGVVAADGYGRIWYGSRDKTAYGYYHAPEDRFYYLDANGRQTSDYSSLRINNYFTDQRGNIWACTEQGVLHFDCSGEHPKLLRKYTIADGLPSDYIPWGTEDQKGIIWLVSGRHLCRLDPSGGLVVSFSEKDGYPVYNTSIGLFSDGNVFLKAGNGYYTFQPETLKPVLQKATLVLTSFRINDQEVGHGSRLGQSRPLIVPDEGRHFSLEFAALDLANPELCRFEYRLDGFDKQWVDAGDRHFANFTNIPAGKYRFKVKIKGQPEEEALVVPLIVEVAIYKTRWFQTLFVLLALGSLLWMYFRRELHQRQMRALQGKAQLLEKEKALMQYETLRQQLNPHFLFNSLTSLNSLITIDPKAAATFLDSLSKTYRYILKSSERDTVPLVEELKFGESFVKLQKTRFGDGLKVQFRVNEDDLHRKIVPVTLQNLIENAIKHNIIDEESPLLIEVFTENGYFVVRNNLQKKNIVETSNQRGLANLASFYKYLSDQEIVVEDDGEHFTIKIPLI
jgi:ligand-binding sensor domain-containing protein